MAELPLVAEGVGAGYGGSLVVNQIDLTLRPGEVLALLGPNGSGKSTLVKALTGQVRLREGRVRVSGADLAAAPERAKAGLGFAVDAADLPTALTGRQYFDLVAAIRACDAHPGHDALVRLDLAAWLDQPIGACSLGTRAKLSLAAALIGDPPLLLLDESLNGLDPVAAFEAKRLIATVAECGRAVLVATHVVEIVPTLCTRAVLLVDGRIARDWTSADLAAARSAGAFEAEVMRAFRSRAA